MKAVLLAGGFGTRLRPMTCTHPKPLVKLLGKPVLSYILDWLHQNRADDVSLTLAYLPESIESYLETRPENGMQFHCFREETPLGTAGSVKAAVQNATEPLLIVSGDGVCDFDLQQALHFHRETGAQVTILCKKVDDPRSYGLVYADENGRVTGFCEKPDWNAVSTDLANTGIYILEPEVLSEIPTGEAFDFSKDLFPKLLEKQYHLSAFCAEGYWCDIGDFSAYLSCQRDILAGKLRPPVPALADGIFAKEALPAGQYDLVPPVYIGKNVSIGDGAVIGPNAVLCDGCFVGQRAKIQGSVLLPSSVLQDGAGMNGAVLCENAVLECGAELFEDSVVGAGSVVGKHVSVGPHVKIWPKKRIEDGMRVSGNIKYGSPQAGLFSESGICSAQGMPLDAVSCAKFGLALAQSSVGSRVGLATDGKPASRAAYHILAGTLTAQGSSVWNFGDGFLSELYFFTAFCNLPAGVFICEKYGKIQICLCCAGGLPLPRGVRREIESCYQNGDFSRTALSACKEISDMTSLESMYLRELSREAGVPLHNQSVRVLCHNEKIHMLLEDCLFRLEAADGDEITLKINNSGTAVSAFHRECGWVPFDKLLALCCQADFAEGHDVALRTDAPYVLTTLAGAYGRRVLRYLEIPADDADKDARQLALSQLYARDALFLSLRLLGILQKTGKSLPTLLHDLPGFSVRRKVVPIDFPPTKLLEVLHAENATPLREGVALHTARGHVFLMPMPSGKSLRILAEANDYETSRELCGEMEERLRNH